MRSLSNRRYAQAGPANQAKCAGFPPFAGWHPEVLGEMSILKRKNSCILSIAMLAFFLYSQYPKYIKRNQTNGQPEPEMLIKHAGRPAFQLLISPLFSSSQATSLPKSEVVFLLEKILQKNFFKKLQISTGQMPSHAL